MSQYSLNRKQYITEWRDKIKNIKAMQDQEKINKHKII